MIATKKPSGKGYKQFVGLMSADAEKFPCYLRTAKETGWLTDGVFFTKLSEEEHIKTKVLYNKTTTAKKADFLIVKDLLPATAGYLAKIEKITSKSIKLVSSGGEIVVDSALFTALQKRHSNAQVYINMEDEQPVLVFSEKTTVAMLLPKPVKNGKE